MPIPKLYYVTYEFDVIVLADDEKSASETANMNAKDSFGNGFASDYQTLGPTEIKTTANIPYSWGDALPYDDYPKGHEHKQERSVVEWLEYIQALERQKRLAEPAPGQLSLPLVGDVEVKQESKD